MSPISPDDIHRIFKSLDKNNNGEVSIQELHHLLDRIGIQATLEELEEFVGHTSLDYIDFEKMVRSKIAEQECDDSDHQKTTMHSYESDLLETFKVFDMNGDGYITCDELQNVLSRLGLWDKRSGSDCKDMICVYDENSDGVLDFGEFKNMMSVNSATSDDSET